RGAGAACEPGPGERYGAAQVAPGGRSLAEDRLGEEVARDELLLTFEAETGEAAREVVTHQAFASTASVEQMRRHPVQELDQVGVPVHVELWRADAATGLEDLLDVEREQRMIEVRAGLPEVEAAALGGPPW